MSGQEHHLELADVSDRYSENARAVVYEGDNIEFLQTLPARSVDLIVTSPPYNLGKVYETKADLDTYLEVQRRIIAEAERVLGERGSLCWQVGNYVENGHIVPLDILLYDLFREQDLVLRNRIVWTFGHGLHSRRRFSGRYETVLWFTRDTDEYYFDLDAVRVPQKYPGKRHYKGPKAGEYSGHPQGKNPSDVWEVPNVKANHIEKTSHPCQFPIALVQRLVRALTPADGIVLDPFLGVGSAVCAALIEGRRGWGSEIDAFYAEVARERVSDALEGHLRYRPIEKPIYEPVPGTPLTTRVDETLEGV
ncbi:MAG: DNA-methyltransferase [Coriobacteriia bacterium]